MEFLAPAGATMSGGPLAATFSLVGAHFHWGVSSCLGSEHTLNGVRSVAFRNVDIESVLVWNESIPILNKIIPKSEQMLEFGDTKTAHK